MNLTVNNPTIMDYNPNIGLLREVMQDDPGSYGM